MAKKSTPAKKPAKPAPAKKPRQASTAEYDRIRERARARIAQASKVGRDIGGIPDIANLRRRTRCRESLKLFCETYNPDAFSMAWSADHLRVIARIEEVVRHAALYALAMPRGSGKTSICRMAALWALSYAFVRYPFIIGANSGKAEDTLSAIKTFIRFLPNYGEDFPEISWPVRCLGGIANRASGQLCGGESTLIEWAQDRIVLPTVPCPANWPKKWAQSPAGKAPTSGSVVSASGLTGDGIRGSLTTLPTGEQLRPDLVLLDDPQTNESARSPSQNHVREQLVSADVLGMAGPGKSISAVMPCTCINEDDFVDRLLNRSKHPLWRGERTKMLRSMPANLSAWDAYFDLYQQCAVREPPDFAESNVYYRAHQVQLEEGAEASWAERKLSWEISAIQHAMHLYCRDRQAFFSEYQNDPQPLVPPLPGELCADDIAARINRHQRSLVPARSTRLTGFIDVSQDLLWFAVCAWEEGFTGAAIDYGAWPDQGRTYYTLAEARPTISAATGIGSLEGSLTAGLGQLVQQLCGRDWRMETGGALKIDRLLIDSGWGQSTELVKRFCRQSPAGAVLLPSKGIGIGASSSPMIEWARKPGERRGLNWLLRAPHPGEGRLCLFDANWWKSFIHARLGAPLGERGALTLFGDDARAHRMFADHLVAEYRVRTKGRGRELDEWKERPHRPDNHLLDCLTGCAVAASIEGANLLETARPAAAPAAATRSDYEAKRRQFEQRRGF